MWGDAYFYGVNCGWVSNGVTTTLHIPVGPLLLQLQSTLVDQHRLDVDKRIIHRKLLAHIRFYWDCANAELLQHITR